MEYRNAVSECVYLDPEVCTPGIVALAMFELDLTQHSSFIE